MTLHGIEIPRERIEAFCHANGIRRLALFGSILHDDFRPESDKEAVTLAKNRTRAELESARMFFLAAPYLKESRPAKSSVRK